MQKAAKDSWRHMALSVCVSCKIRHFVAFRWHDASQVVWSLLPGDIYDTLIATHAAGFTDSSPKVAFAILRLNSVIDHDAVPLSTNDTGLCYILCNCVDCVPCCVRKRVRTHFHASHAGTALCTLQGRSRFCVYTADLSLSLSTPRCANVVVRGV